MLGTAEGERPAAGHREVVGQEHRRIDDVTAVSTAIVAPLPRFVEGQRVCACSRLRHSPRSRCRVPQLQRAEHAGLSRVTVNPVVVAGLTTAEPNPARPCAADPFRAVAPVAADGVGPGWRRGLRHEQIGVVAIAILRPVIDPTWAALLPLSPGMFWASPAKFVGMGLSLSANQLYPEVPLTSKLVAMSVTGPGRV